MIATLTLALALQLGAADTPLLLNTGDGAPPFSMRDLNHEIFSLRDHLGQGAPSPKKAMLLVFFATWCKPCMKEIPIIKDVHKRWKAHGVEVVYVGLSQGAKELGPFAKEHELPWRVVPDSFGLLARRYGVSQLPHLFVLDGEGKIAFQHRGIAADLKSMVEAQLARLTGASPASPAAAPQVSKPGETTSAVDQPRFDITYTLARVPSSQGVASRWQPLAAFVGEALGANVQVVTEASYEAFEAALKAGKYDFANAGPMLCYELRDRYEPLVTLERQGTPTYFGLIFALKKSGLKSLDDLRGKSLALVSSKSTSGGLYPELALLDAGLVPGKDVTLRWVGSHSAVAEAVKSGKAIAGGCYEDCREALWPSERERTLETRVLSYTPEIPAEAIIVRRDLDAKKKAAMRKALLAVGKEAGILGQISEGEKTITAVVPASDADLQVVGEAMARLQRAAGK